MKSRFYMLVGLPGSGKSTIAQEFKTAKVFSSDALRKELWGNESTQGDNKLLFKELHKRIKECLSEGNNCIYDATNIRANTRINFLKEIKDIDCKKICIFVAADINVCLERNNERERKVPDGIIKRMYLNLDIPQYREGWDDMQIISYRDGHNDYDIYKFMENAKKINHDNPHHLLTIGDHICAVTKYIIDNYSLKFASDENRLKNLVSAAFYHDIGKIYTKSFINSKGEKTDIAHYYNHEKVSAYMYILYNKLMIENNLDNALYISDLIGLHMRMYAFGTDNKDKALKNLKKTIGKQKFEDLCILHEADMICG